MPEGDTIFRAARTLDRALRGETVESFRTVLAPLARVDTDEPIAGRTIEGVTSAGKHLLMSFSGDLVLRTHLRMHGSWHIYRRGEPWKRPARSMRVAIATARWEAVGFNLPEAEFVRQRDLRRNRSISRLGPDLLSPCFDAAEAVRRIQTKPDLSLADALLDQSCVAGIGNVYKSEILFLHGLHPGRRVDSVDGDVLRVVLATARELLNANVADSSAQIVTWSGSRRTTGRSDPEERLWIYGRGGRPCRRCGSAIEWGRMGRDARSTYWCPQCQP